MQTRKQKISINLTQDGLSGEFYTVQSIAGSSQLLIGQKVERARVDKWTSDPEYDHVTVRITGLTKSEETGEEQLELLAEDKPAKKQTRKPLAMAK